MNLSDKTKRKLITLLLEQVREKHNLLTNSTTSMASISSSWECMAQFNGYVAPEGHAKAGQAVAYDEAQDKSTVAAAEKAVRQAMTELDEAYTELHEVLNG